ncbi:hypothetical protein SAHC1340_01691 [Staphylococcus aureus]|nr:hypothetical protein SAHC1340_01691 [Staphylococcus aureus]EJE56631.1 hypothetical protein Newbould305_1383 [Staphylococcus aureus subsp. aureus str. Newbould 305]EOR41292.1 hypothetical protein MRGR3_0759 [Staphylococcus aureus subsp. aureus MRGR3]ALY22717.1 hypothetical protein SABE62_01009 [Staphylococcus aureus]ALY25371.1 hypothetical protein SAGV51_01018 [Staphylococcus aureus]
MKMPDTMRSFILSRVKLEMYIKTQVVSGK